MSSGTQARAQYTEDSYGAAHPDWHEAHAAWKAARIADLLEQEATNPRTVCDVGCGTGGVLEHLGARLESNARLVGYEPATAASAAAPPARWDQIELRRGGPDDGDVFELALMLDVFEHVEDYLGFLRAWRPKAPRWVFHIPLDLCLPSLVLPSQFDRVRTANGHLHFFTAETALTTLREAGYEPRRWTVTAGALSFPQGWRQRLMLAPRSVAFRVAPAFCARYLGGCSLLVLADAVRV